MRNHVFCTSPGQEITYIQSNIGWMIKREAAFLEEARLRWIEEGENPPNGEWRLQTPLGSLNIWWERAFFGNFPRPSFNTGYILTLLKSQSISREDRVRLHSRVLLLSIRIKLKKKSVVNCISQSTADSYKLFLAKTHYCDHRLYQREHETLNARRRGKSTKMRKSTTKTILLSGEFFCSQRDSSIEKKSTKRKSFRSSQKSWTKSDVDWKCPLFFCVKTPLFPQKHQMCRKVWVNG